MNLLLDPLKRAIGRFDSKGLRHSQRRLAKMRSIIAFLPAPEQARYVDEYNKQLIDNGMPLVPDALDLQKTPEYLRKCSTTDIGVVAYLQLNSRHAYERDAAVRWLMYLREREGADLTLQCLGEMLNG